MKPSKVSWIYAAFLNQAFSKIAVMGVRWKILLEIGEKPGMEREGGGGMFIMGEWEIFEVCRWQRQADPPIFCLSPLHF